MHLTKHLESLLVMYGVFDCLARFDQILRYCRKENYIGATEGSAVYLSADHSYRLVRKLAKMWQSMA